MVYLGTGLHGKSASQRPDILDKVPNADHQQPYLINEDEIRPAFRDISVPGYWPINTVVVADAKWSRSKNCCGATQIMKSAREGLRTRNGAIANSAVPIKTPATGMTL